MASKKLTAIAIVVIVVAAAFVGAYWWFFLRPVTKKGSTISLVAPSEVPEGENVAVVGEISPAVADAKVTLTFTNLDATFNVTVNSEADGFFTCKYTVDLEGEWYVVARWPGNSEYKRATSVPATFTVLPPLALGKSAISCVTLLPRGVDAGESVTVMGWTYPVNAEATVTLNFTRPDGTTSTESVTSDADGSFRYTYATTGTDIKGVWGVTASWPGTAELGGATSRPATFTIFLPEPIKIGVIRNLLMQGQCMEEASIMAMEEINDAGGVLGRKIVLAFGDEGTEAVTGTAEIERLITVEKVDFITGGYRSDIVFPMREIAMDHKKIFIFDSATNELLNCFGSLTMKVPCYKCVRCDYNRYKYMFRIMPPNSTLVFMKTLIPFLKYHLVSKILAPKYGLPVKVAAVIEDLVWTDVLDHVFKNLFQIVFGPNMTLVSYHRPSSTETDFSGILSAIKDKGARLVVHVLSGEAGLAFIKQWGEMKIPAIPCGVNVLSQGSEMWPDTEGKCEYEAHISPPVRAAITDKTIPWWDRYVERWGHHPLFTAMGSYMAIYTLTEAVERAGKLDSDAVVDALEKTDRISIAGRFKFTQYHDIYIPPQYEIDDKGNFLQWVTMEYVQPMVVQWQKPGEKMVIYPFDKPYTKEFQLPPWM